MRRRAFLFGAGLYLAALAAPVAASAASGAIVVFAAASLKNALDAINAEYQKATGKHAQISYAASSTLAKQIENAAPAVIFISADLKWMDYLDNKKLIDDKSRVNLLGNALVLIAPKNSTAKVTIGPNFPLAKLLGSGRLAMADPTAVPAGLYGKAALIRLGVWASVSGRVAAAENVRAALALVARGEAPFGIVYKTDAAVEPNVKIVGVFPEDSVPPIVYPMALIAGSKSPDAAAFAAYLRGPQARKLWEAGGFTVLDTAR
ncbi:MAG TPA: molybdate ABC transporter substrate-binding protein [Stellaceae bacterium]|nr:molybdate ABC transporter substrate-binding protein [Stellaceae bacterium]